MKNDGYKLLKISRVSGERADCSPRWERKGIVPFFHKIFFSPLGADISIASASAEIGVGGCGFLQKRGGQNTINSRINSGSRVTSRHLQIDGPVDGDRLILHHLPLERTVARPPWPTAALNLARRHRHFRSLESVRSFRRHPTTSNSESSRTIADNGRRAEYPSQRDGRPTYGKNQSC